MSGTQQQQQQPQPRLLKSSPNLTKQQGPMKATLPMHSLLKQTSNLRKSISPTLSPTSCFRTRIFSDFSGQRSPGSSNNKGKGRTLGGCLNNEVNAIRRTASLDTIYLKGQWPRENIYCMPPTLQIDKATQTEENEWIESRKLLFISDSGEDKFEKIIRQRLQRSTNQQQQLQQQQQQQHQSMMTSSSSSSNNTRMQQTSSSGSSTPLIGDHTLTTSSQTNTSCFVPRALPVNIPIIKPLPRPTTMRNSVEGLNQEIERLVLKAGSVGSQSNERYEEYDKYQITPEGHRAPFPDIFRPTRSVNTQTPSSRDFMGSSHSSSPPSRGSISPMVMGHLDTSPSDAGGSRGSSPEQESNKLGTSPHIFLARGPPDGCERVHLKSLEYERRSLQLDHIPQPCTFQLKPSQGSAFKLLQPNLHPQPPSPPQPQPSQDKDLLPLVPSEQDLI